MAKTILLADDSVTIQKVVELTFMGQDYQVVAVSDGSSALTKLDESRPDIVIADVHMPGPNGYEVTTHAKQKYPGIPVLLLVGTFEPFNEEEMAACGAEGYLKKPFDSQDLMREVERHIGVPQAAVPVLEEETQPLEPLGELPVTPPAASFADPAPAAEPAFEMSPPPAVDLPPAAPAVPEAPANPGFAMSPPVLEEPPMAPVDDAFALPAVEEETEDLPPLTLEEVAIEPETVAADNPPIAPAFEAAPPVAEPPSFQATPVEPTLAADPFPAPTPEPSAPAFDAIQAQPEVFETMQAVPPPMDAPAQPDEPVEVAAPEPEPPQPEPVRDAVAPAESAPASNGQGGSLADEDVDRIARRVVELLSENSVREVAWEVVPDLAELIIRERIRELENQIG